MSENKAVLISYSAESFMGIDKSSPVFIDFTGMKKNGFVEMSGDQGRGKTSRLTGIAYAMGAALNIDKKKLMNRIDKAIDEEIVVEKGDATYKVVVTDSRVTVKRQVGEGWKNVTENTPTELVKDIFGPVGMSPLNVKEMDGKKQIEFFQKMFGSGEDASKKIKKLEDDIDAVFDQRRDVNRDIKNLRASLELDPLFQDYEKSQARFKTAPNEGKEKKAFEDLEEANNQYNKAVSSLTTMKENLADKRDEIKELEAKLAAAQKEEAELSKRVDAGYKWVEENKDVPAKYEKAKDAWMNVAKNISEYNKWKEVLKKEKQLIEWEDASTRATGLLDDLRVKLMKATKECLPDVEGLEIKVNAGLDKDAPHGVFYKVPGKKESQPLHELSESEYIDMWCQIWAASDTKFLFIENITSLGSDVVKTLNALVKKGLVVFYTEMDRKQKVCEVTFKNKID